MPFYFSVGTVQQGTFTRWRVLSCRSSLERGLELMCVCLSFFCPSFEILPYLRLHLDCPLDSAILKLSKVCLSVLLVVVVVWVVAVVVVVVVVCLLVVVAVAVSSSSKTAKGHGFNSRSGHYQVATAWMGDCQRTGKLSQYMSNIKVNSAYHSSRVGKSSTSLSSWG